MHVTVGYTAGDLTAGYRPSLHGWRSGAAQRHLDLELPDELGQLDANRVAAAALLATNLPDPAFLHGNPPALAIFKAFEARGLPLRALTVGDTITVDGTTLACVHNGWMPVPAGAGARRDG